MPHFGGVHGSYIKRAKLAIYAILQLADITDEELYLRLLELKVYNISELKSQWWRSSNTKSLFIWSDWWCICTRISWQTYILPLKRWSWAQELVKHFWKRWLWEYLPTSGSRKKWHKTYHRNFKVGDIVLVAEAWCSLGSLVARMYNGGISWTWQSCSSCKRSSYKNVLKNSFIESFDCLRLTIVKLRPVM